MGHSSQPGRTSSLRRKRRTDPSLPETEVVGSRSPHILPHSPVAGLRRKDKRKNFMFDQFLMEGHPKRCLKLGRAPGCEIRLPRDDTRVSKVHCVLERLPCGVWAIRNRSRNGTLIYRPEDPVAEPIETTVMLSLSMEIWIAGIVDYIFIPVDARGKIGLFAMNKTQLHAKAFDS